MGRIALAGGGLAVVVLVGLLLFKSRSEDDHAARGASRDPDPAEAGSPVESAPPAPRQETVRPAAGTAQRDPLPTPAEQAEARERVAGERPRPRYLSPDLVMDHKLTAGPMREARKAFQRREYDVALARSQDALAVDPKSSSARVLATLAACALGDQAVADAHASKLDAMRRGRIAGRCKVLGVELKGQKPSPEEPR